MIPKDAIIELENPPEIVTALYPRFADACAMGAAALRRDGRPRRDGNLAEMYKAHLDRIFDACGAVSVDEVVGMLNGGGNEP